MSIQKVTFPEQKNGLRLDARSGNWVGYKTDIRSQGKRLRNIFGTKAEAESFVDAVKQSRKYQGAGLTAPRALRVITLEQLVAARLETITTRKRRELESRVYEYLMDLIRPQTPVLQIRTSDLKEFVRQRSKDVTPRKQPIMIQTVDRELTVIAAMLHAAPEYFDELENYTAPRIPHPKYRTGRRERVITDAERDRLLTELQAISPQIANIVEIAFLTGLRHGEIVKIRAADLDLKARSLKVYRPKTNSVSHIAPLTDRMLELLTAEPVNGFVFTANGKTPAYLYRSIREAAAAAGIPYGRYEPDGIVLHDARHSFITKLQQAGVDLSTIQSFSGHSTKEMVMRYSHAGPESRRRAMEIIDGSSRSERLTGIFHDVREGRIDLTTFLASI